MIGPLGDIMYLRHTTITKNGRSRTPTGDVCPCLSASAERCVRRRSHSSGFSTPGGGSPPGTWPTPLIGVERQPGLFDRGGGDRDGHGRVPPAEAGNGGGGSETFILRRGADREAKERAMRQRFEQRIEKDPEAIAKGCARRGTTWEWSNVGWADGSGSAPRAAQAVRG